MLQGRSPCPPLPLMSSGLHLSNTSAVEMTVLSLLKGVHPSPGEHRRHAPHDAPEPPGPLGAGLGVPHPAHQPVEHHQHAVVVLRCRHLVEVAVRPQGQQPALLAGHRPSVVEVPLVAHDDDGSLVCVQVVPDGADQSADGVETGSVTDAVDEDATVGPPQLLRQQRRLHAQILSEQVREFIHRRITHSDLHICGDESCKHSLQDLQGFLPEHLSGSAVSHQGASVCLLPQNKASPKCSESFPGRPPPDCGWKPILQDAN